MLINRIVEFAMIRSAQTPFLRDLQKNRAARTRIRRRTAKVIESFERESETGGRGSQQASEVSINEDSHAKSAEEASVMHRAVIRARGFQRCEDTQRGIGVQAW